MVLTKSSAVTKPNVNLNVEVSSNTSLSQNTHKEGMSRGTRDTNLVSDTEAKNTAAGKTSEHPSRFSANDAVREKSSRKRRLQADSQNEFLEKEDDDGIFQVIWASTQMIILTNLSPKKNLQESILVENPVPLNLHPLRKMDEFMDDI